MVGGSPLQETAPPGRGGEDVWAGDTTSQPVALDFEQVYTANFDFIWRAVRGLGVPVAAVDDVTQEVFLIVHRKLSRVQSPDTLRSWLFGVARRVCKDYRRAAGRRGQQLELDEQREVDTAQDPQQQAQARQALQVVEGFAEGLDEERRALFFLALIEGLPIGEVAETLGLNANTTYSRVRVLRQQLTERLDPKAPRARGNHGPA